MSSFNRKMRRRQSAAKGRGNELRQAMQGAQSALTTINASKLEELPGIIDGLKEQTKRASALADALADDYETVSETLYVHEHFLEKIWNMIRENTGAEGDLAEVKAKILEDYRKEREEKG